VLDLSPKRVDALIYRASAYRQLGSLDLALDDATRALTLDPNAIAGLLERGNIRRLKGDSAGAKVDWQRILALAPKSAEAQAAADNLANLVKNAGSHPPAAAPPTKTATKP
jgi:tetratricopeptide (TPR) repeat protein